MNDEIKEILDRLDYNEWEVDLYKVPITWCELYDIRDCITNLQQELKEANDIIVKDRKFYRGRMDEYAELKKENERLKNDVEDISCSHFSLFKSYEDYKSRCEKASDKIQYIIDYGFDYDGFNTVESLKGLIDMLVDYARESKNILQNGSEK